jgi:hypothetical protein
MHDPTLLLMDKAANKHNLEVISTGGNVMWLHWSVLKQSNLQGKTDHHSKRGVIYVWLHLVFVTRTLDWIMYANTTAKTLT